MKHIDRALYKERLYHRNAFPVGARFYSHEDYVWRNASLMQELLRPAIAIGIRAALRSPEMGCNFRKLFYVTVSVDPSTFVKFKGWLKWKSANG